MSVSMLSKDEYTSGRGIISYTYLHITLGKDQRVFCTQVVTEEGREYMVKAGLHCLVGVR